MTDKLQNTLKNLPTTPGVYFHKDKNDKIIYIGKAANLRNRVRQYFQKSRQRDPKTDALVAEIADVEWTEVETELDALFLEAELIRRYLPPYNILLRDDKSMTYVRIDHAAKHPTVTLTRRPLDDNAKYYGPYFSALTVRRALKYLRRIFPFSMHKTSPSRACLQYHLGLCPGIEEHKTDLSHYRRNLTKLSKYLQGQRSQLIRELESDMNKAAKEQNFEQAAEARNQLQALRGLKQQIVFGDKEIQDISKDKGLMELAGVLGLKSAPKVIEGYDISHMQGTNTVASMVVFRAGVPNKAAYRKFKMRILGNDDFAHMNEVIQRRLSQKNIKLWGVPSLFLIDGGKGQLSAAIKARDAAGIDIPMIGLAKREETIVVHTQKSNVAVDTVVASATGGFVSSSPEFMEILLPRTSHAVKLLQRIRDESHRFAVSYHTVLKRRSQTASWLDEIPTIGPMTRKKLLRTFGSVRGIMQARQQDLEKTIGERRAQILRQYIRAEHKSAK